MNAYSPTQVNDLHIHRFAFVQYAIDGNVLSITLNRPEKKNALHPQMMNEIAFLMHCAHYRHDIWVLTIAAKGSVFCAGADLKAMAGIIEENDSTIPEPDEVILMAQLFSKVHKPVISIVTGDVYAGGFFFLAGSQIVLAQDDCKLGLPEVKRGLYPFQIMAALMKVMPTRKVIDWCIRGYTLSVNDAEKYGLITELCSSDTIYKRAKEITQELLLNSPSAIRLGLESFEKITEKEDHQAYLFDMLQKTISTNDAQEGLRAFREKRNPQWTGN